MDSLDVHDNPLVTGEPHLLHQARIPLGDPAHHEEGGPHLRAIEQIKEGSRGRLDSRRQAVPPIRR